MKAFMNCETAINASEHNFMRIENPCVGGSIPPQATKIPPKKTPASALAFFSTHFKFKFKFRTNASFHIANIAVCFSRISSTLT